MAFSCKILADTQHREKYGPRITTMEVTFPRIILAEFNTHRMLSRNSASSRAIPVEKMIARVESDTFIPSYIGANQKGMQAGEELSDYDRDIAVDHWLLLRDAAIRTARGMLGVKAHKQVVNRTLELFSWHTVIVTATDWLNFFALRCNKKAEPHMAEIACMMRDTLATSKPNDARETGGWHLPLVYAVDYELLAQEGYHPVQRAMISCARCARVSYLTHDGKRDPAEDIKLANRLRADGHMSPFEHAAHPSSRVDTYFGNFVGWVQLRKTFSTESVYVPRHEDVM